MKTINAESTGNQFIQDINDNFGECLTGGGDGNVTVSVPLQGGELKSATGYVDGRWCTSASTPAWTDDNFYKFLHTPCYLSLKGNKVKGVSTTAGSTLSIFCYDDTFALLNGGVVNDADNIPDGTSYVKMQIYNASGYANVLALEMTLAAQPKWVKNTGAAYTPQFFNYDCKPPKLWDNSSYTTVHSLPTDSSADVDTTRYHDNALVLLPPNYSPDGVPCKVVFWFNGDGCPWFIEHGISLDAYVANFGYLNACGYAVVMCTGYTSMWKDEQGAANVNLWVGRVSPAYIASVRALYDRVMANYNFDPQVYLGAKSAGGGMLLHTAITRPFPIRAAAGISVCVCNFDIMRHSLVGTQKTWQKRLGCANWNDFVLSPSGSGATATLVHNASGANANQIADSNRLIANKDIIRKYDPFGMSADINWDAFVTQCLLLTSVFNDGADYPSALTDVVFASHKVVNTPLKYWCATKDAATPFTWHKIMVDWINRNGGIAELRSYTGSDGKHSTFSGSDNKTATVSTPYGGNRTAGIGFVEMVDWFKRW